MENEQTKIQALTEQVSELQLVCQVWVAANEAKDERITELEAELARAQGRIARLSRLVGRQQRAEPPRKRRITEAR